MERTFRLGRLAGVEVELHWTWLLAFALFAYALATGGFPSTNPGLGNGTYAAMAVVATLLFFVSLLLHELGHALVARREHVEIDGITLWLFGGVARLRGEMPSPGKSLSASAWLMITTLPDPERSVCANARPRSSGIPAARK